MVVYVAFAEEKNTERLLLGVYESKESALARVESKESALARVESTEGYRFCYFEETELNEDREFAI